VNKTDVKSVKSMWRNIGQLLCFAQWTLGENSVSVLPHFNIPLCLDMNGEKGCVCLDSEQRKTLCTSNYFSCEYKTALRQMEWLKQEEGLPSKHEPVFKPL
jgi:hypothetical protein